MVKYYCDICGKEIPNKEYDSLKNKYCIPTYESLFNEETRKFAMDYYGWSDDEPVQQPDGAILYQVALSSDEGLPFQ